jgi:hypothetical protein
MSKAAVVTTDLPAAPAAAPAPKKPFAIQLVGPGYIILHELCAHVRNGYVINPDAPYEFFANGNVVFNLILGNPDELSIARAKESTEHSAAMEEAQYQRDVAAAAKTMLEQERREALEKEVAEAVAASEKAIAKLKRDAQAELDRLNK